ncbi:hypothetical protein HG536_0C02820 [Torulaspora globosa]|uniref:Large ribosomal subunit protein uL30-like ferredoxin-like fold domain-containing protein n=1 Tax=Torulaspora globosa TaxID=48254 RepID=A0A7G3ZF27_9SACH|nr:uncharacterized protein HG536_0C02820 [Torulaspora globosa]QLL32113.1 hypothetical protein HG536_0C02820 [Torulaspora globosa]
MRCGGTECTMVETLNSSPEVLLRRRRNAERTKLEKQQLARQRDEKARKQKRLRKQRFIRAESMVAKTLATEREKERVKRVSKLAVKKARGELDRLASDRDYIVKVRETADEDDELVREKFVYDGTPTLLFVVRVRGPAAVNIPHKAFKILKLMRLVTTNTGVFVRLSEKVYPLLKIIAPYVVVGRPSLSSIRSLLQKRSRVVYQGDEDSEPREVALNDNNIIEEKLGEHGIICVEDIVHEIASLGDSFSKCAFFLQPFELNREISGFGALNKLKKIKQREDSLKIRQFSNSATAPVIEIDIDSLIAKLN